VNIMRIKPQPAPGLQLYDYIVEIYVDKITVKSNYGDTVLQNVNELNSWLSSVRDRKIAVFSYAPLVREPIILTRNHYYFVRGRFEYILLKETDIVLISNAYIMNLLNADESWRPTDTSRSYIHVASAEYVQLHGAGENITVIGFIMYINLFVTSLDAVVAHGTYLFAEDCTINYLNVDYLYVTIWSSQINNYCYIATHYHIELRVVTVNASGDVNFTVHDLVRVPAHGTETYSVFIHGVYIVELYYVHVAASTLDVTPVTYTYSFNAESQTIDITITNPNDVDVTAFVHVVGRGHV
jgi:hypothetical protein